jgi:hypothetical protein
MVWCLVKQRDSFIFSSGRSSSGGGCGGCMVELLVFFCGSSDGCSFSSDGSVRVVVELVILLLAVMTVWW